MTDQELAERIKVAYPLFEAKIAAGEIVVRKLEYTKKGPPILHDKIIMVPPHVPKADGW